MAKKLIHFDTKLNNIGTSFHGKLGHHNLESVILDLMIAGIETTSTALTWGTLFMIKYPDIQRRVQNEIFTQVIISIVSFIANVSDKKSNIEY